MTALPSSGMIYDFGRQLWLSTAKALVDKFTNEIILQAGEWYPRQRF